MMRRRNRDGGVEGNNEEHIGYNIGVLRFMEAHIINIELLNVQFGLSA